MHKKLTGILTVVMLVVLLVPIGVSARTPGDGRVHDMALINRVGINYDEMLNQLNTGHISPENVMSFFFQDYTKADLNQLGEIYLSRLELEHMGIAPMSSPWDNQRCSNIFGHSIGEWSHWWPTGQMQHAGSCGAPGVMCIAITSRSRTCTRANCSVTEFQIGTMIQQCRISR